MKAVSHGVNIFDGMMSAGNRKSKGSSYSQKVDDALIRAKEKHLERHYKEHFPGFTTEQIKEILMDVKPENFV